MPNRKHQFFFNVLFVKITIQYSKSINLVSKNNNLNFQTINNSVYFRKMETQLKKA